MPVSNSHRPPLDLKGGVPAGPGRFSVPESSASGATMKYVVGQEQADRVFNGDGLHLSAEAKLRNNAHSQDEALERLQVRAGVEGVIAKVDVVRNGELNPRVGLSLRDGYFKQQVREGGEYLKDHPAAAVGAVAGAVVVGHLIAKETGDDIKVDTGKIKLYRDGGLTASVVGEVAITGEKSMVRGQGAKLRVDYNTPEVGNLSVEAGYDRDSHTRVQANWSKTFDSGMQMNANAFYEDKTRNAGVFVGLSYKW